jgi:hypothetical protein
MNNINFDNFKVRCSAISQVMAESSESPSITEKQLQELKDLLDKLVTTDKQKERIVELQTKQENSSKVTLSTTCIKYLMAEYSYATTGKISVDKEFQSVFQMDKGRAVEHLSLATLCMVDGVLYTPNDEKKRVSNEFLSGEVDCYLGETIIGSETIPDIKSVWDYPTFLSKLHEKLSLANIWQLKGYGDITGASNLFIADVLTTTDEETRNKAKYKLLNKLNCATEESPEFLKQWKIIERSMIFDDIHPKLRVNKKHVDPITDFERTKLYDRVKACRDFLNKFHEKRLELINS